jgi:hypothetical protein
MKSYKKGERKHPTESPERKARSKEGLSSKIADHENLIYSLATENLKFKDRMETPKDLHQMPESTREMDQIPTMDRDRERESVRDRDRIRELEREINIDKEKTRERDMEKELIERERMQGRERANEQRMYKENLARGDRKRFEQAEDPHQQIYEKAKRDAVFRAQDKFQYHLKSVESDKLSLIKR